MRLTAFALTCAAAAAPAADRFPLPPNSGAVDVTNWSADPALNADGRDDKDDTAAIQAAIHHAIATTHHRYVCPRPIYLPDGVYKVSGPLEWRSPDVKGWSFGWLSNGMIFGQSTAGTVLKLADRSPGFTDPADPRAVIRTGTENGGPDGGGNGQAFHHYVRNLTVDCGDNPGAVGIDFLAHNRGAVKDVVVKGNGVAGISLLRAWPGPALVKNVTVDGFAVGIDFGGVYTDAAGRPVDANGKPVTSRRSRRHYGHGQYGMTFEDVTLRNQRRVGFQTDGNLTAIRRLTSVNAGPAVRAWGGARLVVVDADLRRPDGAAGDAAAVVRADGPTYLRNVRSAGYPTVVRNEAEPKRYVPAGPGPVTTVGEWVSDDPLTLFPESSSGKMLGLPVEETPETVYPVAADGKDDFSQWADATAERKTATGRKVKAVPNDGADDLAALQAAVDEGKPAVYLPTGIYHVSRPLVVRGGVRLLIGYHASIDLVKGAKGPAVRFAGDGTTVFEHLYCKGVEHTSNGTLVLKHCSSDTYRTTPASRGKTFVEDCVTAPRIDSPADGVRHRFWARQLNAEVGDTSDADVVNRHGDMWVLNLKTEYPSRTVDSIGGATEILGAFIYTHAANPADVPSLRIDGGRLSAACLKHTNYSYPDGKGGQVNEGFENYVRETRGGVTRDSGPYGTGPTLYVSGGTR